VKLQKIKFSTDSNKQNYADFAFEYTDVNNAELKTSETYLLFKLMQETFNNGQNQIVDNDSFNQPLLNPESYKSGQGLHYYTFNFDPDSYTSDETRNIIITSLKIDFTFEEALKKNYKLIIFAYYAGQYTIFKDGKVTSSIGITDSSGSVVVVN